MNAAERSQLQQVLHGRCEAIADSWYQAVARTSYVPLEAAKVRQRLAELTEEVITLLLAEPFERGRAEAISASLVRLYYAQPEALGRTQEVLAQQLVEGLPANQVVALHSRLAALLGGLAAGFFQQARETILVEQESIRGALITERKRAEEALRQRNRELTLLHRAGQTLTSTLDLDRVLNSVLEEVRRLSGVPICSVWLIDSEADELVCQQATGLQSEIMRGWRLAPGEGIAGWVARSGESLIVTDTRADKRHFKNIDQQTGLELRSILSVPLRVGENVVGVLEIVDAEVDRFTPADLALVEPLAATAAVAIGNAHLYQSAQRELAQRKRAEEAATQRATQLALLNRIGSKIATVLELDSLLEEAARLVQESFGYHHVALFTMDREREELLLESIAGGFVSLFPPDHQLKFDQGMVGWVSRSGKTLLANDVSTNPYYFSLYPDEIPTRSELSVPLRVDEDVVGVLDVQSLQLNAFDENDVMVMETLANQIATAIQNARLYEAERAARERLRNLTGYLETAREEERTHIAREIHDDLGQALTALRMDVAWLTKQLPADKPRLVEKASAMSGLIDSTLQTVRRIATDLRPGMLDHLGLVAAIEWQAQELAERARFDCELLLGDEDVVLDPDLATAIFRIFQETLTNIARHAEATKVCVKLEEGPDEVVLIVRDNGRGITKSQAFGSKSLGLIGMQERARSWGGDVTFQAVPGQGTTVIMRIPRARAKEGGK